MRSTALIALCLSVICTAPVRAQQLAPDEKRAPVNEPYITGTGATVPNPGKPQGSATTPLDRGIEKQDNKIDNSICKGC